MADTLKPYQMITDFITGRQVPNIGAEENRQALERFLVEQKGYLKTDIEVDVDLEMTIAGDPYRSQVDLVISAGGTRFMAVKCAAASLGSREREIIAAARLLDRHQIPVAVVSDGKTAIVLDAVAGKKTGEGLAAIPSKAQAQDMLKSLERQTLDEKQRQREQLIFRTYDSDNVNVQRNI